jgi:alkanesulfonate monooxygenase SsuD/methylene tetrahydromethanopterin reductase-like flavin-dependent oxidoreductase (luciferase family)
MRVGISLSSTSRLPVRDAARHLLDRVRRARDAGLDTMSFGDSHTRRGARYFQNTPTVARALAEWDPQRPAGCLFLVPMWPPVLLAEQVGTLAALHEGRFIVQTGLGGGPDSFAAFGASRRHRGDALDEAIRVVDALFAGETVSSEMFGIVGAAIDPVPPDGVDWWVGTMSAAGLERAGRLGAAWYASHGATESTLPALTERYRASCAAHDTSPYVAVRRDALVLADGDRARRLASESLSGGYRGMTDEMIVAGSPIDVAEQLEPLRDLGVDEVVMRTMGIAPEHDLETIELLGEVRRLVADD